jgi:hypothetical protein
MGAFYMEACRLSQGFGSHAMGEKKKNIISWKTMFMLLMRVYFAKGPKTML